MVTLTQFRDGSTETKASNIDDETLEPRYSLKFGEKHGPSRLDLPRRMVITTYQTLRDYQFSLSQIDWGLLFSMKHKISKTQMHCKLAQPKA
ncbi:hypothetical protein P4S73_02385 [Paraglaciecola sp. Hal342]